MRAFLLGFIVAIVLIVVGAYIFISRGGVPMAASSKPLPLETTVAHMALRASYRNASKEPNPLPVNEENLMAGAHHYHDDCVVCHGTPGSKPTDIAAGMFPTPPQLFDPKEMVTDDPEGVTFWKVTNGIRLSGMPGFKDSHTDTQRWQLTMLLKHADTLPPAVQRVLTSPAATSETGHPDHP